MHTLEHQPLPDLRHQMAELPAANAPTLKDLRRGAGRLTTPEAEEIFGIDPIEQPALAAIFEAAFADAPPRGLTYPEEIKDLCDWLGSIAVRNVDGCMERDERLLALTASYMSIRCEEGDRDGEAAIELVRAVATFFLRTMAATVADVEHHDRHDRKPGEP
jgi:hypothetical protein